MWQGQILAALTGLCGGAVVAAALAAFITGLGMIPRYAGITHTGNHLLLYEDCLVFGALAGNIISIYDLEIYCGRIGVGIIGLFFGIFLGSWIIALGEVVNVFAVVMRRLGIKKGVGLIVLSIAAGKTIGALWQFFMK